MGLWQRGRLRPPVERTLLGDAVVQIHPDPLYADVAQLVEHVPEEHGVRGSTPFVGTIQRTVAKWHTRLP